MNERAEVKDSRQNNREIKAQDDNITENTNARSPLTFRNLLLVDAYMQIQETRKARETFCISESTVAVKKYHVHSLYISLSREYLQ